MGTKTVLKSNAFPVRIRRFAQGATAGVAFYAGLAFLAIWIESLISQRSELCRLEAYRLNLYAIAEQCMPPRWIYALLYAISWGPGIVVWLCFGLSVSERLMQVIAGLIFGGLAGVAFVALDRKWGTIIFLSLYIYIVFLSFVVIGVVLSQ